MPESRPCDGVGCEKRFLPASLRGEEATEYRGGQINQTNEEEIKKTMNDLKFEDLEKAVGGEFDASDTLQIGLMIKLFHETDIK